MNPVSDLVNTLDGDSALGLTKGTDLWQGPSRGPNDNIPIDSVFVYSDGGLDPQRFMGQVSEIREALLIVRTRSHKFTVGNLRAQAIQNTLQGAVISGYLDIVATESLPVSLGVDENGNHLFMSIFKMVFEEVA